MNERSRRRLLTFVALAIAGAALLVLALSNLGEDLVYYWSPSELKQAGEAAYETNVRLGGVVAPGSIRRGTDGLDLAFAVTDGRETVPVAARAVPPAMFREGIGVVVEGSLERDGTFHTTRLMVMHDNEYRAPDEEKETTFDELMRTFRLEGPGE